MYKITKKGNNINIKFVQFKVGRLCSILKIIY